MGGLKGETKTKNRKKGRYKGIILFIVSSAILGFIMGYLSGGILEDFFARYMYGSTWYMEIFNWIKIVAIFILGYLIHIIIHEIGHLIFGLLSGYSFVSFRVGSFTLIKEDGKLKSKRYSIPGTAGQCLMMPPEKKDGDFPFILYNLGGALLNTIVSIISILMAMSLQDLSWTKLILVLSSGGGIFAALTNAIPLKVGGIANDGHNIMTMVRDKDSRESFYLQLRVNGLLSKGTRIKDMDYDGFLLKEDVDYKNPLNFTRILINHVYHLDKMDLQGAKAALDFGEKYKNDTILIYQLELAAELLFLELIGDCNKEKVESLYDKNLRKYIKASKFMISKTRLMMAYEAFYKEDRDQALKYYEELKELARTYPIKGEADMETMLGDYMVKRIQA